MSLYAAVAAIAVGAGPLGEVTIGLRGGAGEVTGALQSANEEAITLIQNGAPRSWPWSEVGVINGTTEIDILRWQHLGTDLWRAQQRLIRGDVPMAIAAAKRARANCGSNDRVMQILADRALMQAGMQAALADPQGSTDLMADVTVAALEVCVLSASDKVELPNEGEATAAPDWEAQFTTMMPPSLPPAFDSTGAARAVAERIARLDPSIAESELVSAYVSLALLESGQEAPQRAALRPGGDVAIPDWASRMLRGWQDACGPDARLREKARASLDSARTATPSPFDPWIDYAIGRSLARDSRGDEAALRLLRAAARAGERTPLGRCAIAQAAECLRAAGDSNSAQRLEDSLNPGSRGRTP